MRHVLIHLVKPIKAVPNDQCGSVRKVLSVRRRRPRFARPPGLSIRHRRTRFARPPIGVRRDRLSDVTLLEDTHNQIWGPHSVPTSLVIQDQIWGPHSVPTSLVVQDQRRTATTSCERHQSKVTLWNIYIYTYTHAYIHPYIHKWKCCMAFRLWNLYTHAYIHTYIHTYINEHLAWL